MLAQSTACINKWGRLSATDVEKPLRFREGITLSDSRSVPTLEELNHAPGRPSRIEVIQDIEMRRRRIFVGCFVHLRFAKRSRMTWPYTKFLSRRTGRGFTSTFWRRQLRAMSLSRPTKSLKIHRLGLPAPRETSNTGTREVTVRTTIGLSTRIDHPSITRTMDQKHRQEMIPRQEIKKCPCASTKRHVPTSAISCVTVLKLARRNAVN